jgi:peptide deformylase
MTKLSIVTYPEKILKRRAGGVEASAEIKKLISSMIDTMYAADGIGLAAPQVGISKRIIVVETSQSPRENKGKPLAFLNPIIQSLSRETSVEEEGCLSLPGIFVPVKRAENIVVRCETPEGKQVTVEAAGLTARIFQHEIDHLQGKLIIDRAGFKKRFRLRKQLTELQKQSP